MKASVPCRWIIYGYENDFLTAFQKKKAPRKTASNHDGQSDQECRRKNERFQPQRDSCFLRRHHGRAWTQVETAATPEVKVQVYEEVMDWTMLDKKYEDRTQNVFSGPMIIPAPSWWWRYDPTFVRPVYTSTIPTGSATPPPLSSSGGNTVSMPTMPGSAFAASVVGSVSNFSSKVMGGLTGFTNGVTNVTNPPPPPSTYRSSGGGSSGGHSCACACACAGCACACAGGGR